MCVCCYSFFLLLLFLILTGQTGSINTVIKSKTTGLEVAQVLCKIAQKFGPVTGAEFDKHMMEIGFL